jgi:hypothetical protein
MRSLCLNKTATSQCHLPADYLHGGHGPTFAWCPLGECLVLGERVLILDTELTSTILNFSLFHANFRTDRLGASEAGSFTSTQ